MAESTKMAMTKVPEVTLLFWIMKIAATTLGETGGDAVTMSMGLGYLLGSAIFVAIFMVAVCAQIAARRFHRFLYWAVIVATTTAGTTIADFADRSIGIGYAGGSAILFVLLMASLAVWWWSEGSVSINSITTPRREGFYWVTIMFSQTLGTALGDWMADTRGLGYGDGALVIAAALAVLALAYFFTRISRTLLFWSAFILTRPLGATVGDLLDKPVAHGGFALSRYTASEILAIFMVGCLVVFRQNAGTHSGQPDVIQAR
jgi:uncharacterized membrane-anchored protein